VDPAARYAEWPDEVPSSCKSVSYAREPFTRATRSCST